MQCGVTKEIDWFDLRQKHLCAKMGNILGLCCGGKAESPKESILSPVAQGEEKSEYHAVARAFYHSGSNRDHAALFIETETDKSGYLYHVIGSTLTGMKFEHRKTSHPSQSLTFSRAEPLGVVEKAQIPIVLDLLSALPPPPQQFDLVTKKRLDKMKPLIDCQDWLVDAIDLLAENGILVPGPL